LDIFVFVFITVYVDIINASSASPLFAHLETLNHTDEEQQARNNAEPDQHVLVPVPVVHRQDQSMHVACANPCAFAQAVAVVSQSQVESLGDLGESHAEVVFDGVHHIVQTVFGLAFQVIIEG